MIKMQYMKKKSLVAHNSTLLVTRARQIIIPSSTVQFWTFLLFEIPSLACTIFLLYHLLINPQLRKALHNHVIIVFLVLTLWIEVFDHALYIDAYRYNGRNSFRLTTGVCLMWWFVDFGVYGAVSVFLAFGSVERHILVFHSHQLLRTKRQKLLIHYLPLLIVTVYMIGFYVGVIIFPPCENTFDFTLLGCGQLPCYEDVLYLNTWDYLGNGILCTFIETISSIALIIRVFWQKRRARQRIRWRKHRKMAFQLLSISCLSVTIIFPQSLIFVIQEAGGPNMSNFAGKATPYFIYLYAFFIFLLPFICLVSLPELWPKLLFFRPKQQPIGIITPMADRGQSVPIQSRQT